MRRAASKRRTDLAKRRLRAPSAPMPDSPPFCRIRRLSRFRNPKPHFGDKTQPLPYISVVDKMSTTETKRLHFLLRMWYIIFMEQGHLVKTSTRFFYDSPVKAVWDDASSRWLFCAVDVVAALTDSKNPRSFWNAVKRRHPQLSTNCRQLKLTARDGKKYLTDVIDTATIDILSATIRPKAPEMFLSWLKGALDPLDEKSKTQAYELFDSGVIDTIEVGTVKGLRQIHAYIFGGLYDFAGQIRTVNIAKGGFAFAPAMFLQESLSQIESMPEDSFEHIIAKYIEMNVAHPFREGNGRSMRIWLDMMLKKRLNVCTDWSKIDKYAYLTAMEKSPTDPRPITKLIRGALTSKIDDRELFLKGVDYSYYYEQSD